MTAYQIVDLAARILAATVVGMGVYHGSILRLNKESKYLLFAKGAWFILLAGVAWRVVVP